MQVTLLLLLLSLQYRMWVGEGSFADVAVLADYIETQRNANVILERHNQQLAATVIEFKHGLDGVEEQARNHLGMIKKGETFYLLAELPTTDVIFSLDND